MTYDRDLLDLKRDTALFVSEDGRQIALQRPGTFTRSPEGGQVLSGAPAALGGQRFWFQGVRTDTNLRNSDQGEREVNHLVLVGVSEADILPGDTFTLDGRNYKVVEVHNDRRYETRAWVEEV